MAKDELANIIGENSFFEGKFKLKGSLRIDGKFEGEYIEVDKLTIGRTGKINTNINANNVIVEGIVVGNIKAKTRVLLLPTARVLGDIKTPELIIQNGVILEGRCTISTNITKQAKSFIQELYDK